VSKLGITRINKNCFFNFQNIGGYMKYIHIHLSDDSVAEFTEVTQAMHFIFGMLFSKRETQMRIESDSQMDKLRLIRYANTVSNSINKVLPKKEG
jgi:hypothetical protein|tara:strand:- start:2019 stop:2303 length:285 start_codon:yes stop_codon:yes gene_type:complete